MTQLLEIHPENPQSRLISSAVTLLREGGVIAYPTDSAYALGCQLDNKDAMEKIKELRELDKTHNFTLMCRSLSDVGTYARVSNTVFRLLKMHTPGPYTFILPANREVPRRLQHPQRKTIGLRVPDNPITLAILEMLAEPIMSVTLILPGSKKPLSDPQLIYSTLNGRISAVIDGGLCGSEATTIVDLTTGFPQIVRIGKGDSTFFSS